MKALGLVRSAPIVLILAILVLWLQPLLTTRTLPLHDFLIHLRWSEQFFVALKEGWVLPRWAFASHAGLGDPTFVYYQPLFYYITSLFQALGCTSQYALLLAGIVPYLLLGLIVHRLVMRHAPSRWALSACIFVLCSPPLYFLSSHTGLLPWTLGVPISLLFLMESLRRKPRIAVLALLMALLCLSHLLSALMAICCAGLSRMSFQLYDWRRQGRPSLLREMTWLGAVLLGISLSAFFVFPALSQTHLINPDGWTDANMFDWRAAMLFPTITAVKFGMRWFALQWTLSIVVLAMALFVALSPWRPPMVNQTIAPRHLAFAALLALALGSELAYPLYALVPPMQKLQFPYRFMPLAALAASLAFVMHLQSGGWRQAGKLMRATIVLLIVGYGVQVLYVQYSLYRSGKPLPERATFMDGRFGQKEYLLAVRGPFWEKYLEKGQFAGECAQLHIRCAATARSHEFTASIETLHPVSLRLPIFAFPSWQLYVDGKVQPLVHDPKTGLVMVSVPPGRHAVILRWAGTPAERTGRYISIGSLLILLLLQFMRRSRNRWRMQKSATSNAQSRPSPAEVKAGAP